MTKSTISIGSVVRDRFGREGIVCSREDTPSRGWLREQIGAEKLEVLGPATQWWGVMPFSGGYLLCPESELEWLRPVSYEDFLAAVDTAETGGRERLAKTFPRYVDRLLAERRASGEE
jgi:hypothetical protein